MSHNFTFKAACFAPDLQAYYREMVAAGLSQQFFPQFGSPDLQHRTWSPGLVCIQSGDLLTEETFDVSVGYWYPVMRPIRKDLKAAHDREEAYRCQLIDRSCNDCAFFKADEGIKHTSGRTGDCEKFNKRVTAWPKTACDNPCFLHRKDLNINTL